MLKFFEEYYDFLSKQFSISVCQKIINGFNKKRFTTFRINTIKKDVDEILKDLKDKKIDYKKANFYNNAFYFTEIKETKALKLQQINDGYIYLQSFSSMLPSIILNPSEGEKILDITAAPGSKTSLMASLSDNKAIIYANEKDKIRFERLKYNMNLLGCNVNLLNEKAENLHQRFILFFDKILVDAPCSGEGRFQINEKSTFSNWSQDQVEKYSNLQKKILDSALKTLKDNGLCVYSTCTLNKIENEQVIEEISKDFQLQPIDKIDILNNISNVHITNITKGKLQIPVYRILPSELFEGFTIIIFKKLKRYSND